MRYIYLILLIVILSCNTQKENYRTKIDLEGQWQFALDSARIGAEQKWYLSDLGDSIHLPGTSDLYQKGFINLDTTTMHLNRVYRYEGVAWYRKKVIIPESLKNKHIKLFLERTKSSKIWIDSTLVGESHLLQSPQQFDVSSYLTPGEHHITILINNNLKLTPYGNVHIYSDDTQTNWNGIIGDIYLEASDKTHIADLQVYPDIENKKIKVRIALENQLNLDFVDIKIQITRELNNISTKLKPSTYTLPCDSIIELEYTLGDEMDLWDEYHRAVYTLNAVMINTDQVKDKRTVSFGMRKFASRGTQFTINNRVTFLRGKHEAAVFPLTGYPPMDVEGWERVYKIARSYGINHYRFHSYCPPEAAFTAADREGIYLQAELPFWGGLESDSVAEMLKEEGIALLKSYGNHPSFVMFSHGNEIWSGHDRVERNLIAFEKFDSRPLYTMGSNNSIGYVGPGDCSEFFVAARTPYAYDTILTHTRLSHGFCDSKDGGILNTQPPSTIINYDYPVANINLPIVSHEIGQYQIYPDFEEINKYTGVLEARNLEVFRNRLLMAGMMDQNIDFHKASGAWSALCYKAEMEAAIRTAGFAGFQLLDLQDFPGQGTALVGILDAFMDSKNVISEKEWLQSCNDVVILLEFPKFCWTNLETFTAKINIANYSDRDISDELSWELTDQSGGIIQTGTLSNLTLPQGGIDAVGEIKVPLASIDDAEKLEMNIVLKSSAYSNTYHFWVYPQAQLERKNDEIQVVTKLDKTILAQLNQGEKVLLFPATGDVKENSVPGLFPPEFWNYGMFKGISEWLKKPVSSGTLGILTNPEHPVFNSFPTDFHTNWQWFSIIKASNALILDHTSKDYRPIVQVIDNLERNHKLGLLFEFKVGEGKLLVCMSRLMEIMDKPEARQLYQSMISYMDSDDFNPTYTMTFEELDGLLAISAKSAS